MAELNFLPLSTDSWVADTAHLSRLERGLYFDLLILMWRSPECRVPNDIEWIARKLRCTQDEKSTLAEIISEFLSSTGNWLFQKRLTREFERAKEITQKRSASAKSRWNKEKDECKSNAPTPTPTPTLSSSKTSLEEEGSRYAFSGSIIRLNQADFDRWQKTYHSIPDLGAWLHSRDEWISSEPEAKRKNWFNSTSAALNREHQKNLAAAAEAATSGWEFVGGPC